MVIPMAATIRVREPVACELCVFRVENPSLYGEFADQGVLHLCQQCHDDITKPREVANVGASGT